MTEVDFSKGKILMTQEAVEVKTATEALFTKATSSFPMNDVEKANEFYGSKLGLGFSLIRLISQA